MNDNSLLLVLAMVSVTAVVALVLYSDGLSGNLVRGDVRLQKAYIDESAAPASARPMSDSCRATFGRCYYNERGPTTYCPFQIDGKCPGGCSCLHGDVTVQRSSPWWRYNLLG
ncbi:hypothetical protein HY641_03555 [Candidatus Woesearchaeota archaeon]|nr:hypothetical protein [Candidatus Woesearchaeota archaeon]